MKKLGLITALFCASIPLFGMDDINSFINKAYEKNKELKSLEASLDVAKQQISVASNWQNPTLSFGATDVWLSDITNRNSEPMQAYFVGISQTLPLTKKLKTKQSIARNDLVISKYTLEDKKLKFRSDISLFIYNIALLEERILLYTKLQNNVEKLEELLEELYKYNKVSQTQILNTQVLNSELSLKKVELYNLLQTQRIKLEKITYSKYDDIKVNLELKKKTFVNNPTHPKILNLQEQIKKYNNISLFEKQKKNSDLKVGLTYFERDDKFEDYVNLSFAMPLSVYGSEDIKSKKAKFKTIELKNKLENLEFSFKNELNVLQANMNSSINTFKIIKNNILPKLNTLQKNLENYNSFSKVDSTALIKNLNEIIKYELKAINEKQKYFTSLSKASYFSKEIK